MAAAVLVTVGGMVGLPPPLVPVVRMGTRSSLPGRRYREPAAVHI